MPLGNPTPLRQEMFLTNLARSTPGFRIKQFLNPDCLMMEVSGFPRTLESYELYKGSVKMPGAEDYETFVPKYKHLAKELNEVGSKLFAKRKAACYPVIISKGFDLIVQEGLNTSKKESG